MHIDALKKVMWITLAWVLIAMAEFGHMYSAMSGKECLLPPELVQLQFYTSILSGFIAGLIGGSIVVYYFNDWLRKLPYGKALLRIFVAYTIAFFGISVIVGYFFHSGKPPVPIRWVLIKDPS